MLVLLCHIIDQQTSDALPTSQPCLLSPCHCLVAGLKLNTVYTFSQLAILEIGLMHLYLQYFPSIRTSRRQQRLSSS